jgi:hypothetical protein
MLSAVSDYDMSDAAKVVLCLWLLNLLCLLQLMMCYMCSCGLSAVSVGCFVSVCVVALLLRVCIC